MAVFGTKLLAALAGGFALSGCLLFVDLDGIAGGTKGPTAGDADPVDAPAATADQTSPVVDATDDTSQPARRFTSCKDLRLNGTTANGVYRIDPDGDGVQPSVEVYCEMTIDGGGWTLVARSVEKGTGPFGWRVGVGTVGADTAPYSLGGAALLLAFTEVLVAGREGEAKAIGPSAYKLGLASSDLIDHETTAVTRYSVVKVLGTCTGASDARSMNFAGHTSYATAYFLRNIGGSAIDVGLKANGFDLGFADCAWSGLLHGLQGMLFVR